MLSRLMDQLLCATVEPGGIGLIVIGKGKRKSIESVTKVNRKCCETNSKAVYSVSNHVDAPKSRFMSVCFDLENE